MKKGDRVIWDSGFGYEIGYCKEIDNEDFFIEYASGSAVGRIGRVLTSEIFPYSDKLVKKLTKKYGYEKRFSEVF